MHFREPEIGKPLEVQISVTDGDLVSSEILLNGISVIKRILDFIAVPSPLTINVTVDKPNSNELCINLEAAGDSYEKQCHTFEVIGPLGDLVISPEGITVAQNVTVNVTVQIKNGYPPLNLSAVLTTAEGAGIEPFLDSEANFHLKYSDVGFHNYTVELHDIIDSKQRHGYVQVIGSINKKQCSEIEESSLKIGDTITLSAVFTTSSPESYNVTLPFSKTSSIESKNVSHRSICILKIMA